MSHGHSVAHRIDIVCRCRFLTAWNPNRLSRFRRVYCHWDRTHGAGLRREWRWEFSCGVQCGGRVFKAWPVALNERFHDAFGRGRSGRPRPVCRFFAVSRMLFKKVRISMMSGWCGSGANRLGGLRVLGFHDLGFCRKLFSPYGEGGAIARGFRSLAGAQRSRDGLALGFSLGFGSGNLNHR